MEYRGSVTRSGSFLIHNTRLVEEFGVQYAPFQDRVLQIINDIRKDNGKPPLQG